MGGIEAEPEPTGRSLVNSDSLGRFLLLALLCVGCATTAIAPGAEKIRVTTNRNDVAGCRAVGSVEARGPFSAPDDWMHELQNQALGLGADIVFQTSSALAMTDHVSGVAYRCEQPGPSPAT